MGTLFETIKEKIAERIRNTEQPQEIDYRDDYETRDKHLKALRRNVRRLMDEKEKNKLQAVINKQEEKRGLSWTRTENNILDAPRFIKFKKGKRGGKLV